ncbi:MAG: DUF6760 family protein [Candidatus Accumulibacter phosphatis]|nr:DUF6760 family protein [Candidatus Accumulibacter contiguus]
MGFHFHWPQHEIMDLDHLERRRWVSEIARINRRLNEQSESG